MTIEDISKEKLANEDKTDLFVLRLRFLQLWDKNFLDSQNATVGNLNKTEFLDKYRLLIDEMSEREYQYNPKEIDKTLLKTNVYGLNVGSWEDVMLIPNYISIAGGYVSDPAGTDNVDVIIRASQEARDENTERKIKLTLNKKVSQKVKLVYSPVGPRSDFIPLYDLVAIPRQNISITKLTRSPKRELDALNKKFDLDTGLNLKKQLFDISKTDDEQIVSGVVYEPYVKDSQGDYAEPDEIRKAAYGFMENAFNLGINHDKNSIVFGFSDLSHGRILESYIAPCDFDLECSDGSLGHITKGTWMMTTKIRDSQIWKRIRDGNITGYSLAGTAKTP